MEDYSSEINNLIYVDRDIEDAKWEKIGREIAKNEGYNDGKNEGRAEGRAEGRIEGQIAGEQKKQQEMVENLLGLNVDIDTISKASGLSVDEILKIKDQLAK